MDLRARRAIPRAVALTSVAAALMAATSLAHAAKPEPKIVVLEVAANGVAPEVAAVVTELIQEALLNRHALKTVGPSDMRDMLSAEQQKMLLGCTKSSCMAEIAGAMGADRLIAGMVGRLGSVFVVTLKLIDSRTAEVTSRASREFPRIEAVSGAVGPLVDELLGAQPRIRALPPALAGGPPEKRPAALEPNELCKRVDAYERALLESTFDKKLVTERKTILDDLVYTPFLKQFNEKRSCIWSRDGRVGSELRNAILRSLNEADAMDARRRSIEWSEMTRQLELLQEAYTTGFEKEKSGAGARPSELPFEVKEVPPEVPADTPEVRRYLDEYLGAQKVVALALESVRGKDPKKFEKLWAPEDPKRSRTSPSYIYDAIASAYKGGYQLDPCPLFLLTARQIQQNAERLRKEKILEVCVRKMSESWVSTDDVWLLHVRGEWKLDRW